MTTIVQIQQTACDKRQSDILRVLKDVALNSSEYCTNTTDGWTCDFSTIDQYLAYEISRHPDFPNHFVQVKYPE
jgi:hypothetical protein